VLFWGRRVYWGAVLLVVSALRQGRAEGYAAERLKKLFGVRRSTLVRWLRYFREIFPQSRAWRLLSARLLPPVAAGDLTGMIERFAQCRDDPQGALVACLQALRAER
jgi:hypothetical protein